MRKFWGCGWVQATLVYIANHIVLGPVGEFGRIPPMIRTYRTQRNKGSRVFSELQGASI